MILTVTINPLLEQRLTYNKVSTGNQNRNGKLVFAAGGKGINVSRQLNKMNVENIVLTFAGGTNGKVFRSSIQTEGINFSIINTASETRVCTVVVDSSVNSITHFFSENQNISREEVQKFILKMEKMIENCEIVIFSGSSPCEETDIIFPTGIEIANKLGKPSFCDTYGNHLKKCYKASPTVVHNNIEEVECSLQIDLNTKKDKLAFLDQLYRKNIKQVFLTNGPEKSYASNFDFHYEVSVPNINYVDSTGSGDSFFAGIANGWHKSMVFEDQVKLGTALGAVNASTFNVSNVDFQKASRLMDNIEVIPVGKKLNMIDDTPN
ncbi:1-phosphofructokinase family hexose kinase [Bacteroidota bacterium]